MKLNKRVIRGQGMTEYIIIVALIAIAAIGVFTGFGDVVRGHVGQMAGELAGAPSQAGAGLVTSGAGVAEGNTAARTLGNYQNTGGQ